MPAAIPRARYSCEVIGIPSFAVPRGNQVSCNEQCRSTTLTFYGCRNGRPSRRRRDLRHPVDAWGRIGCMTTPTREIHLASRPFGWPTHDDFRTVQTEL